MINEKNKPDIKEARTVNIGKKIIAFIGSEGAGKTWIAKKLALESQKPCLSVGDIIRETALKDEGTCGDECREALSKHRYVNPHTLFELLRTRFKDLGLKEGFILDGSLRSIEEINGFQKMLGQSELKDMPVTVIHLRVPGWISMQRLVYVRKREDDTLEGALGRLSAYYSQLGIRSCAIQNQKGWELLHVDANVSKQQAFKNTCMALQASKYRE